MGRLLETDSQITLTVSPDWAELNHLGLVSDRVLPGSDSLCPFLDQNSVVRVQQSSPGWARPGSVESMFQITLTFPDGERSDQLYSINPRTTVPQLQREMGDLLGVNSLAVLTVSPDWDILDHLGPVSALVFPGSSLPCHYLFQGSVVRVSGVPVLPTDDVFVGDGSHVREDRPYKRLRDAVSFSGEEGSGFGEMVLFRGRIMMERRFLVLFRVQIRICQRFLVFFHEPIRIYQAFETSPRERIRTQSLTTMW
jgi:hypothetical protein